MQWAHPIISIIVPTYNRAHLLPRLFHSLLSQNDCRFELVVVDDGSTDRTPQVVEEFRSRFEGRLICVHHPSNRGCNAARNTGVRAAQTPWALFMDSDWELLPDSIQRAVQYTTVPKEIGAVAFLSLRLPKNKVTGYGTGDQTGETAVIPLEDVVLGRNITGWFFGMIRRSVFWDDGLWLPEWVNGMEQLFAARLARRRQVLAVRHVLGIVHQDPAEDHISADCLWKWPSQFARGYETFIVENFDILRQHVKAHRRLAAIVALCHLYDGSYWTAVSWAVRARYWKVHRVLKHLLRILVRQVIFRTARP